MSSCSSPRHGYPMRRGAAGWRVLLGAGMVLLMALAMHALAQESQDAPALQQAGPALAERSVDEWLAHLRRASSIPSYVGTFVSNNAAGTLSSARIWHLCEGEVERERVDMLTGRMRSTFRQDEEITLFLPRTRVVRTERRLSRRRFPDVLGEESGATLQRYYIAREAGVERVAGFEADVVVFSPRDTHRFGHRIWSERQTGLILKTQVLDAEGQVLEQAAFSELQINLPPEQVAPHLVMPELDEFRVEQVSHQTTTAAEEGWTLKYQAAGFKPRNCYRRVQETAVRQCMFSDGLASISLFFGPVDEQRGEHAGWAALGATHALSQRWPDAEGPWWVTLIGEVPMQTLQLLLDGLDRNSH